MLPVKGTCILLGSSIPVKVWEHRSDMIRSSPQKDHFQRLHSAALDGLKAETVTGVREIHEEASALV